MTLEIVRRIRGNLHGSIDVSLLEDAVIRHPFVQRLRRVKQLAFLHYVFPGASHSRFEHSLGVLHMAGVAWERLKANQIRLRHTLTKIENFKEMEEAQGQHGLLTPTFPLIDSFFASDYNLQVFRLAGLMHDLGHPPFSHSGERFLPSWVQVEKSNPDCPPYLKEYLRGQIARIKERGGDPAHERIRHEVMSMFMIARVMEDTYRQYPHLPLKVSARDIISVISRAIDPEPGSPLLAARAYELLRELISGEVDIDRMDYLLRDARECGVVYGIFDHVRILDSLCLYFDPRDSKLHVAINFSGLAALEDYLRARHSMYLQLYFHKTSVAAEAMLKHVEEKIGGWHLPAKLEEYAAIDEYNIGTLLAEKIASKVRPNAQKEIQGLVDDLLLHRRLWKRAYEITSNTNEKAGEEGLKIARRYLEEKGWRFAEVSSANSLTRFRPREENAPSQNYLRLVKKDERQIPRVCPIEDYSDLIANNQRTSIHRIYVEAGVDTQGVFIPERVKKDLTELLKNIGASRGRY